MLDKILILSYYLTCPKDRKNSRRNKQMTDQGTYAEVNKYIAYTDDPNGMEVVIGRRPALALFGDLTGLTVADFGCGPATNPLDLRRLGARQVIGIDINEAELVMARQIDPDGIYIHYDGVHLADALRGYSIDAILASFSFCTIPTAQLRMLLKDMRSLLSAGAKMVVIDPNLEHALGTYYPGQLHYHAKENPQTDDDIHVTLGEGPGAVELFGDKYRTDADYQQLFAEAGFTIKAHVYPLPDVSCTEDWAEVARKKEPFVVYVLEAH